MQTNAILLYHTMRDYVIIVLDTLHATNAYRLQFLEKLRLAA